MQVHVCLFFKILCIYFFRDGERREKEREKHLLVSHVHHNRDPTCNPGVYPDQESNWPPFPLQDDTQPTEPHQLGLQVYVFNVICVLYCSCNFAMKMH